MTSFARQQEMPLSERAICIRDHFLAWQCRQRQFSVRQGAGRPSGAMRPRISVAGKALAQIIVVINKCDSDKVTSEFRHMVLRTQDPADRYCTALRKLAESYYQRPHEFSDCLTALFSSGSRLVDRLVSAARCELEFDFQHQYYRIPCSVENLSEHHTDYQATYWHNRLFNPAMPSGVQILGFSPDWESVEADPLPNKLAVATRDR